MTPLKSNSDRQPENRTAGYTIIECINAFQMWCILYSLHHLHEKPFDVRIDGILVIYLADSLIQSDFFKTTINFLGFSCINNLLYFHLLSL